MVRLQNGPGCSTTAEAHPSPHDALGGPDGGRAGAQICHFWRLFDRLGERAPGLRPPSTLVHAVPSCHRVSAPAGIVANCDTSVPPASRGRAAGGVRTRGRIHPCETSPPCPRRTCTCTSRGRCAWRPSLSWPPARARVCPRTSWTAIRCACPLTGAAGSAFSAPMTRPGPWCVLRRSCAASSWRPPWMTPPRARAAWRSRLTRPATPPSSAGSPRPWRSSSTPPSRPRP